MSPKMQSCKAIVRNVRQERERKKTYMRNGNDGIRERERERERLTGDEKARMRYK